MFSLIGWMSFRFYVDIVLFVDDKFFNPRALELTLLAEIAPPLRLIEAFLVLLYVLKNDCIS
jgi:hypothetical protein